MAQKWDLREDLTQTKTVQALLTQPLTFILSIRIGQRRGGNHVVHTAMPSISS